MKINNYPTSSCRCCRFYNPEGRRGGHCSQLNVSVQAHWKSCQLGCPIFNQEWQTIPEIAMLEKSFTLGCATPLTNITSEQKKQEQYNSEEVISSSNK